MNCKITTFIYAKNIYQQPKEIKKTQTMIPVLLRILLLHPSINNIYYTNYFYEKNNGFYVTCIMY